VSKIKLVGIPSTAGCRAETSAAIDQQHGPAAIRKAISQLTDGFNTPCPFEDVGDLKNIETVDSLLSHVKASTERIRNAGDIAFNLGGAHTLTLGTIRALAKTEGEFALVYIDAHPDLMPRQEIDYGSTLYHALKDGLLKPENIFFLGVRQIESEELETISAKSIASYSADDFHDVGTGSVTKSLLEQIGNKPVLLSIDLDGIDPVFAPGVTTPYPLGMLPAQALALSRAVCANTNVVTAEIVELSPMRDIEERTAKLAGAMLIELTQTLAGK